MLGLAASLAKGGASLLTYVKDNLKLYLDFKSNRSDELKFPSEGSTSFDGTDDVIKAGNLNDELRNISNLSVSAWIYPTHTATGNDYYSLVNQWDYSSVQNWGIWLHTNGATDSALHWNGGGSTGSAVEDGTKRIATNQWTHVCATKNGSTIKLYVNGSEVVSGTDSSSSVPDVSGILRIGSQGTSGSDDSFFKGKMANVALWSRVLSSEEVQSVMNKSYSQLGSVEKTSLVSWWALDTETLSDNLATGWTSADAETLTTSGANITSAVNSSGHANIHIQPQMVVRYRVYKVSYDYTLVSGGNPHFFTATNGSQDSNVSTSATMASLGSSWYFTAGTATGLSFWKSSNFSITVDNFSIKAVTSADSHGSNTGYYSGATASNTSSHNSATTTTSVYGGNAPILPRAIDIAESQADAIGNGSASFDGNDDIIDFGNPSDLQLTTSFTISAWVKSTASGTQRFITKYDGTNKCFYLALQTSTGKFRFNVTSSNTEVEVDGTSNLLDSEWHHLTAVYDAGTSLKVYVNGILENTNTSSIPSSLDSDAVNFTIGAEADKELELTGNVAGVGIWRGALTQAQIQSVMESTSYAKIPADVKSTLGSELVTNATDWTDSNSDGLADNWTNQYVTDGSARLDYSIVTGNGFTGNAQRFDVNSEIGSDRAIKTSATVFTSSKLYKVSFKYRASISSGSLLVMDGGSGATVTNITTHTGNAKLFETYYVAPTGSHLWFYMQNADANAFMEIDEVSVKEVTCDLVAYYPLDADSEVKALSFDGTDVNDKITFTRQVFSGAFTVSWWFKGDVNTDYKTIIMDSTAPNDTNIGVNDTNGQLRIYIEGSNEAILSSVPNNEWCHIAFTRDGSGNIKTYLNGVAGGTSSDTGTFALDTIGRNCAMSISSVSMYNVEKSASEVLSIYNDGIGGDESSNSGLQLYYKLDNASTVTDLSGNGNNGTVAGATLISAGATDSVNNNDGVLY